jgi:hypothetical protein
MKANIADTCVLLRGEINSNVIAATRHEKVASNRKMAENTAYILPFF